MKKLLLKLQALLLNALLEVTAEMVEEERAEQYDCYKKSFKGSKRFIDENVIADLIDLNKHSIAKEKQLKHINKYGDKTYLIERRNKRQAKREMRLAYYN